MLLLLAALPRLSGADRAHNGRRVRIFKAAEGNINEALTTPGFEFAREAAHIEGIDLALTLLGKATDNPAAVILLQMPPGHVLDRHAHDAHRMEVVISGSVFLPDGTELLPGDIATSGPMDFYGPLTAGAQGSLTVEIFGTAAGLLPHPAEGSDHAARVRDFVQESLEKVL